MLKRFRRKEGILSLLWMAAMCIYFVIIFSPASLSATIDEAKCSSGNCSCSCSGWQCACTSGGGSCDCTCILGGETHCSGG